MHRIAHNAQIRSAHGRPYLPLVLSLIAFAALVPPRPATAHPLADDRDVSSMEGTPAVRATSTADYSEELPDGWWDSQDVLYQATGDPSGYHIYVARERQGWNWAPLASIQPGGGDDDAWTGYHCVTGDGRFVVAVVAPRWAVNRNELRDRGGLAYVVNTDTGEVSPLTAGVALKYHTPGCGQGNDVALVRHLGVDQERTELLRFDAESRALQQVIRAKGQLVAAVPLSDGLAAVRGSTVVELDERGGERVAHAYDGQPFSLHPNGQDGVDLLVADTDDRTHVHRLDGGRSQLLGSGQQGLVKLYGGADGRNVLVGDLALQGAEDLVVAPVSEGTLPAAASSLGGVTLERTRAPAPGAGSRPAGTPADEPVLGKLRLRDGTALDRRVDSTAAPERGTPLPDSVLTPAARSAGASTASSETAAADQFTTPACAVPRNDVRRQVPQPNSRQVDWAIQQATRNLLVGTNARPANFLNLGLGAYSPSSDFPRRQLAGAAASVAVPPLVIQATYAQESAWRQASFRSIPGVPGNPLVSDYYGAVGTLDRIDYANSDCGYGLSQVTDPMFASSRLYSANGKTKVAVDYAENAAAGIQFLVDKWNLLHAQGVTMNNGDPSYLENWYFALWAYNTGFNSPDGAGRYGLGWTNNPAQNDYPPDRQPFLRTTYADAERPGDWPYQERVLGWMENPLRNNKGDRSYVGTGRQLAIPDRGTFCDERNSCDLGYEDPTGGGADYCMLSDRHCWWH